MKSLKFFLGKASFFISIAIFLVCGILVSWSLDPNFNCLVWALLAAPLVIHIIGWYFIHNERPKPRGVRNSVSITAGISSFCAFYNWTMLFSVSIYCVIWMIYSLKVSPKAADYLKVATWFCLLLTMLSIAVQLIIIAVITYLIMEFSGEKRKGESSRMMGIKESLKRLKYGLQLCPFWRLAHFFAIFMSITFLFGFAFAFHDQAYRSVSGNQDSALFIEGLAFDEKNEREMEARANAENPNWKPLPIPTPDNRALLNNNVPTCFYFESDGANFIARQKDKNDFENTQEAAKREFMRFKENYESMNDLITQINNNKSKGVLRLILIGSADDNQIPPPPEQRRKINRYPSNYDLSEARIQTIKNEITKELYSRNNKEWQSIDWITIAHSNEDYPGQSLESNEEIAKCAELIYGNKTGNRIQKGTDETPSTTDPGSGKRSVAAYLSIAAREPVTVAPPRSPNLLDYMYFSIYTITTTGYGDIKPATRYAKFLVSVENFFEVFFLVCFMNTLIALKKESENPTDNKPKSTSGKTVREIL